MFKRETRKDRARKLLRQISNGPSGMIKSEQKPGYPEFTRGDYECWFDTWIARELIDLIPELRKNKVSLLKELENEMLQRKP